MTLVDDKEASTSLNYTAIKLHLFLSVSFFKHFCNPILGIPQTFVGVEGGFFNTYGIK